VVGHAAVISAGEWVTASGEWINDRTHGQQYKAKFLKTSEPTSLDGIEKYLGSGMIRGIGPVYAKKLVRAFGEKVFDTIEAEPQRLREVTGIGPVRANRITGLGRTEDRSRNHGLPSQQWRWHGAGGQNL
jgi:exodeoxyribonuclease V alpha subunit